MIAIFLFFNIATGKQAWMALSNEFRHCNVITYDGEAWINFDFDREGIKSRVLDVKDSARFVRHLKRLKHVSAMVIVDIKKRKEVSWKLWWVRTCNELDRYLTGVDVGITVNPSHLYHKLLRYDGLRNYHVLHAWRRKDGFLWRGRQQSGQRHE